MSKERKYQDHEVREILDLAIGHEDAPAQSLPAGDGLTLHELQAIGREVGLPPDRITRAVAAFEGRGESVARGTSLGLPISVGRVVSLPRTPSDREWELLIGELRTTFGGKGEVTSHGGLREWSHGSLHAFIEPTEAGHRLRLTDSVPAAVGGIAMGGMLLAFALLILVVLLGKDDPGSRLAVPAFFALVGGGLIAGSVVALPKWAREQEKRMEHISSHAVSLLALPESRDG
jgi:plasmid stability protein